MAEVIKLSSNIKKYAVVNENDEVVAEIKLDISDTGFYGRFVDVYDNLEALVKDTAKKFDSIDTDSLTLEDSKEVLNINDQAVLSVVGEIDRLFGNGFTREMLKEHYEINENYIPDIYLLVEFFEQITPVIKKVFQASAKKYSVKKGKK